MAETIGNANQPLVDQDGNPAVLDYAPDFGVFYHNGTTYKDSSSLCKQITTASGKAGYFIGPHFPDACQNIVGNCDFKRDTHDWVAHAGTVEVVDGKLKFTADAHAKHANCSLVLTDAGGCASKAYRVKMRISRHDTADDAIMFASCHGKVDGCANGPRIGNARSLDSVMYFSASGIPGHDRVGIRSTSEDSDGKSFVVESIDVRQVVPFAGWKSGGFSLLLDFTTPRGTPYNDQVLWQCGTESQRDKVQILRGDDKVLKVVITANNHEQASLRLGPIENNSRARLGVTLGTAAYPGGLTGEQQQFTACLDGGSPVNSSIGRKLLPGASHIWMKRGYAAGQEFPGKLHRIAVIASQQSQEYMQYLSSAGQSNQIVLAGDSYATCACDVALGSLLSTSTVRTIINAGVGSSTMAKIAETIKAMPWARNATWVIWGGSGDGNRSVNEYCWLIDDVYKFIGHERIVFIPPVSLGPSHDGEVSKHSSDMLAIYNRLVAQRRVTFNPQAILADAMPAFDSQDRLDDAARVVRSSCLIDGIRLAAEPMNHIADYIHSVLATREI